ncbi:PIG-L deacetylase family protein [Nocardioides sp.]|uniref:PIG-L deacetylase family protein n=1 Tax=Nocardioides sp. TaxID=35761 RepID=UPI003D0AB5EB
MTTPRPDTDVERVLVVMAHPDDCDFSSAGTLAAWTDAGIAVTLLCLTRGEQGAQPDADIAAIPALREQEQRAASAELGVSDVRFLDGHPDGGLAPSADLVREIVRVIRDVRPQRIVGQSPERNYDRIIGSHPDHLASGEACLRATYPAAENPFAWPELLDEGLAAWKVNEVWLVAHPTPDHAVDITDTFHRKVAALKQHASQTGHRADLEPMLRQWGEFSARSVGLPDGRCAELFKVVTVN